MNRNEDKTGSALNRHKMRRLFNYQVPSNFVGTEVENRTYTIVDPYNSSEATMFKRLVAVTRNALYEEPSSGGPVTPTDQVLITFEDYAVGPISDSGAATIQFGWSGGAAQYFTNDGDDDEAITTVKAYEGTKSWCFSSSLYNNPGEGSPFTPALALETGAVDETAFNTALFGKCIRSTFYFNAEAANEKSVIKIYNGSYAGDDRTGLNVNIRKLGGGIQITSFTFSGGNFSEIELVNSLAYDTWHKVEVTVLYDPNPPNDTFTYRINDGVGQDVLSWPNVWRIDISNNFAPSYGTRLAFGTTGDPGPICFDNILIEDVTSELTQGGQNLESNNSQNSTKTLQTLVIIDPSGNI